MSASGCESRVADRTYNERYSRRIVIQRGDLSTIQMALTAADDYLLWITEVRGVRQGAFEAVRKTIAEARRLALDLSGLPDSTPAEEKTSG